MTFPAPNLPDPRVVFSNDRLVVVEKPAGMLSVPGKGSDKQDCAVARVRRRFPRAEGPMVVHRLDMETSGLMVVALTADAQRELSRQFEAREVDKAYVALLVGVVHADAGEIRLAIRADIENRPVQVVDEVLGRPSVTRYRVLAREIDRTRVRFEPVTGRTHQIRVHAAAPRPMGLGAPIVGDVLYGPKKIDEPEEPRLMLHAAWMSFTDPASGRRVEVESRVPF